MDPYGNPSVYLSLERDLGSTRGHLFLVGPRGTVNRRDVKLGYGIGTVNTGQQKENQYIKEFSG